METRPRRVSKYRVHRTSIRLYARRRSEFSAPTSRVLRSEKMVSVFSRLSTRSKVGVYGHPECHTPPTLRRHALLAGRNDQSACTACRSSWLRGTDRPPTMSFDEASA